MLVSTKVTSPLVFLLGLSAFSQVQGTATLGQRCLGGGGIADNMPKCDTADGSLRCMSFSAERDVCARTWTSNENGYHCTDVGEVDGEIVRPGFYKITEGAYIETEVCEVGHWVSYLQSL